MLWKVSCAALAALALCVGSATDACAGEITIDFSGLDHGKILGATDIAGVTITGKNTDTGTTVLAIFDTTETGTADPDLEDPWSGGNTGNSTVIGPALIIAENTTDVVNNDTGAAGADGLLDSPDDEGSRPAGWIKLDFDDKVTSLGWDMIDVEQVSAEKSSIEFVASNGDSVEIEWDDLDNGAFSYGDATIAFGDNSLNTVSPITASELGLIDFDYVQFNIGGSMALDNFRYTPVPEPGTVLLFGVGAVGIVALRRRRTSETD